jgi:hypothetical protein
MADARLQKAAGQAQVKPERRIAVLTARLLAPHLTAGQDLIATHGAGPGFSTERERGTACGRLTEANLQNTDWLKFSHGCRC